MHFNLQLGTPVTFRSLLIISGSRGQLANPSEEILLINGRLWLETTPSGNYVGTFQLTTCLQSEVYLHTAPPALSDPGEECNITLTRGGMYWKLRPPRTERFAEVLILHPEAREIARGRSPRAISRAEGCKINAEANLEVRGGRNFQWIPTLVSVITFFFPRRGCFDFSFWPAHCVL